MFATIAHVLVDARGEAEPGPTEVIAAADVGEEHYLSEISRQRKRDVWTSLGVCL